MLKLTKIDTKTLKLSFALFEDNCKDLTFAHPLFTASCSPMNSPTNQTNRFFNGFLSDSAEYTCEYTTVKPVSRGHPRGML